MFKINKMEEIKNPVSYRPKLDRGSIPIILWNLYPLMGVAFAGWKPESVYIYYALETIVLGIFGVIKMLVVHRYRVQNYSLQNYGSDEKMQRSAFDFIMIGIFIIFYFGSALLMLQVFFDDGNLFYGLYSLLGQGSYTIALGTFASNVLYGFMNDFIVTGAYTKCSMTQLLFEPFPRLFVQFVVIWVGGWLVFGNPYPVLILFVGFKIYLELLLRTYPLDKFISKKAY